jgi:hypothetical protein
VVVQEVCQGERLAAVGGEGTDFLDQALPVIE